MRVFAPYGGSLLCHIGDETGEAGFRFERGSSAFFVAGSVLTNQPEDLRQYVSDFREELRLKDTDEISFHRSPGRNRIAFLSGLLTYDLAVRTPAVDKTVLAGELRRLSRADFYLWAFSDLLCHTLAELDAATVVLDEFGKPQATACPQSRFARDIFGDDIPPAYPPHLPAPVAE